MTYRTPMLQQYQEIKEQYPDCLLFFRLGDFYELFGDDAKIGSEVLHITLTARDKGSDGKIPMCGVPFHASENYVARLVNAGYKVAICEQMSEAGKGLVKREVVRVVTAGTLLRDESLTEASSQYILSVVIEPKAVGGAAADLSTGEFKSFQFAGNPDDIVPLLMSHFAPRECVVPRVTYDNSRFMHLIRQEKQTNITCAHDWLIYIKEAEKLLKTHFGVENVDVFQLQNKPLAIKGAAALLGYLRYTQKGTLEHITKIQDFHLSGHLVLDQTTLKHLEVIRTSDGEVAGSLFGTLNQTVSAAGQRLLHDWLMHPLTNQAEIVIRQDAITELLSRPELVKQGREALGVVSDMERLVGRISVGLGSPRDLRRLVDTLVHVQEQVLPLFGGVKQSRLQQLTTSLSEELQQWITTTGSRLIVEAKPTLDEGFIFTEGHFSELDTLRQLTSGNKAWLSAYEAQERERTKIPKLKVVYSRAFGYAIEVSKIHKDKIPPDYVPRQTLVNADRYTSQPLAEYEHKALSAFDQMVALEKELFAQEVNAMVQLSAVLSETAQRLAQLDVLLCFAHQARANNCVRPVLQKKVGISIKNGRHLVIEQITSDFIGNDTDLTPERSLQLITGPNMAGKCLVGSNMIFTNKGLVSLLDLKPTFAPQKRFVPIHQTVKGLYTQTPTAHFYSGGKQVTIRIRTRYGYSIEGTPEHRLWIRKKDGSEGWCDFKNLKTGDYIALDRSIGLWGNETKITYTNQKSHANLKRYPLPTKLTVDLAYLLGLLIGDGTLTYKRAFTLTTADNFIAEKFASIIDKLFKYPIQRKTNGKDYAVTSTEIRNYLYQLGLSYYAAHEKTIPALILRSSKTFIKSFLQGLFDTDGCANKRYGSIEFSSASKILAEQVHLLLLNFGIISSLQEKKTQRRISYRLSIYGSDADLFYKLVGFRLPRKQERVLFRAVRSRPNTGIPFLQSQLREIHARIVSTNNKQTALKHTKSINSIFYTYLPNNRNISYRKLDELTTYCRQNGVPCVELESIQYNNYFYDSVIEIKEGEGEVYDLSVPGEQAYVANGFISHNSTYIRQVALIVLLAHTGSFVPADEAVIGITDRIFTRIGAHDNLRAGQSTFMVEMLETAHILHNATEKSLVILDEVGRGTSPEDGFALAWAIAESLAQDTPHPPIESGAGSTPLPKGAREKSSTPSPDEERVGVRSSPLVLFATHFHALKDIAKTNDKVFNSHLAVVVDNEDLIFLRKVTSGPTDESYGIVVAEKAGIPKAIIQRAKQFVISNEMRNPQKAEEISRIARNDKNQLSLLSIPQTSEVEDALQGINLNDLTPLEALNLLHDLQKKVK